ncbi:hypothetical protein LguiA_016549 [Lonicera macranthoides]
MMMKLGVLPSNPSPPKSYLFVAQFYGLGRTSHNISLRPSSYPNPLRFKTPSFFKLCSCHSPESSPPNSVANQLNHTLNDNHHDDVVAENNNNNNSEWKFEIRSPSVPPSHVPAPRLTLSDQAFFLLAFIACTTSVAFTGLVIAAVPALYAMGRAAISLSKLADTAREELPSTMAAIRLSGMEISDLTLELSDLSQEIADGVNKSAQAMQAAEAGIRQIGSFARHQTMSMIQERASLPIISIQPVVAGAAKKTSRAVGQATKTLMNMISGGEGDNAVDRLDV